MNSSIKKPINIMTSCDENLLTRLSVLLQSIADNLSQWEINFYLLQSSVPEARIELLKRQCSFYGNIAFHDIQVVDTEPYEILAGLRKWKLTEGGQGAKVVQRSVL